MDICSVLRSKDLKRELLDTDRGVYTEGGVYTNGGVYTDRGV